MAYKTPESIVLKTADGQTLQVEKDLKYIGSEKCFSMERTT